MLHASTASILTKFTAAIWYIGRWSLCEGWSSTELCLQVLEEMFPRASRLPMHAEAAHPYTDPQVLNDLLLQFLKRICSKATKNQIGPLEMCVHNRANINDVQNAGYSFLKMKLVQE